MQYITPLLGLSLVVLYGLKGDKWAWRSKKWLSLDEFKKSQKTWTPWAIIWFLMSLSLLIFMIILAVMNSSEEVAQEMQIIDRGDIEVSDQSSLNEAPSAHEGPKVRVPSNSCSSTEDFFSDLTNKSVKH